jgi:hypothetical protein
MKEFENLFREYGLPPSARDFRDDSLLYWDAIHECVDAYVRL